MVNFSEWMINEENIDDIVNKLKKDCSPYIKEMNEIGAFHFFYRGTYRSIKGNVDSFKPRKDRFPTDTPSHLHKKFDEEFYRQYKLKPRSRGVFTSYDIIIARDYGSRIGLFFPIGKYKYIYSTVIEDLWEELDQNKYTFMMYDESDVAFEAKHTWIDNNYMPTDQEDFDRMDDFIRKEVKKWKDKVDKEISDIVKLYTTRNLQNAIRGSLPEVAFLCDRYYLVNSFLEDEIAEKLLRRRMVV